MYTKLLLNHLDCKPSKIWLLIRHGTRLPTANGIKRFSEMETVITYRNYFAKTNEKFNEKKIVNFCSLFSSVS